MGKLMIKLTAIVMMVGIMWGSGLSVSEAVPVVRLGGPETVNVGESFDVGVSVLDLDINDELLAFGFNVQPGDFSLTNFSVDSNFDDWSGLDFFPQVAGIVFPGLTGNDIPLAILTFSAPTIAGDYWLGIESNLDLDNQGLFTSIDFGVFDMDQSIRISVIDSGSAPVPEPSTLILLGAGLSGLVGSRLRRKS